MAITEKHEELIEALIETGISKNVAKCLVYIGDAGEAKSREIENEIRLRQPEVSIATKTMRDNGWLETEKEKKEGKGRPINIYSLSKPIKEIVKEIEKEQKEEIEKIEENLEEMKELADKI